MYDDCIRGLREVLEAGRRHGGLSCLMTSRNGLLCLIDGRSGRLLIH